MDEGTYAQRVYRVFKMMDIRMAFKNSADIDAALQVVKQHEVGGMLPVDAAKLYESRQIVNACVHPDTRERIFSPLRLSMIIPMNMLLDAGMISASISGRMPMIVLSQFANQTYNAAHYYANRNATANTQTLNYQVQAYVGATVSSVGAALCIERLASSELVRRWGWSQAHMRFIGPITAVAVADVLNLALMRQNEFLKGIDVHDSTGEIMGQSRWAGAYAVSACIAGRVFAATPVLTVPIFIMDRLEQSTRFKFLHRMPALRMPTLLFLVGTFIQVSVPLTFGIFKQSASVPVSYLESKFHRHRQADGDFAQQAYYNKGV